MFHSEDTGRQSGKVVEKGGLGPQFSGEGIPQISDRLFQIALTPASFV